MKLTLRMLLLVMFSLLTDCNMVRNQLAPTPVLSAQDSFAQRVAAIQVHKKISAP